MVSFGLLAEITIDSLYGPGDLVPPSGEVTVAVRVLGPSWIKAGRITLYANGYKMREAAITESHTPGVKWSGQWTLPQPAHDLFLVAVAEGPGDPVPFWPIAKPYQQTSPDWHPRVVGSTGAVWIDADGDGKWTSAYAYAKELIASSKGEGQVLIKKLASYDEAVAVQAAALLQEQDMLLKGPDITEALQKAAPATRRGFQNFMEAWQSSQQAREAR